MLAFAPTEISRGARVAHVTQGLILYLDGDLRSIWPNVMAATELLLQQPWVGKLTTRRFWDETAWRGWSPDATAVLLRDLQSFGPKRPCWSVELADKAAFPDVGFDWQDRLVNPYPRTSHLRIRLPVDTPAPDLLKLTAALFDILPIQQGRAGYLCHVHEASRKVGFDQAWTWARRYYGLDIVDPVEESWNGARGVLGVNWLTLVGKRWLEGKLKGVDFDAPSQPVETHRRKHGIIVQAGARPRLGDQNHFEDIADYTLASRLVGPAFIERPTEFPGMFDDHESTALWVRRFLDPTAWQDAS